jgi:hypothetical protein
MISALVPDQSAVEKLKTAATGVEVHDGQGNLSGDFHPAVNPNDLDRYECPWSEDELLDRARRGSRRPSADILRNLRNES